MLTSCRQNQKLQQIYTPLFEHRILSVACMKADHCRRALGQARRNSSATRLRGVGQDQAARCGWVSVLTWVERLAL
jgi:hypothetical protein